MQDDAPLGVVQDLVVGAASEWAHLPVSMPLDTIMVKMQVRGGWAAGWRGGWGGRFMRRMMGARGGGERRRAIAEW